MSSTSLSPEPLKRVHEVLDAALARVRDWPVKAQVVAVEAARKALLREGFVVEGRLGDVVLHSTFNTVHVVALAVSVPERKTPFILGPGNTEGWAAAVEHQHSQERLVVGYGIHSKTAAQNFKAVLPAMRVKYPLEPLEAALKTDLEARDLSTATARCEPLSTGRRL